MSLRPERCAECRFLFRHPPLLPMPPTFPRGTPELPFCLFYPKLRIEERDGKCEVGDSGRS